MKKIMLFVVFVLLINTLPVAAHGGEEEVVTTVLTGSQNVTLLAVSTLLSLLMVGTVYQITPKPWPIWQWGIMSMGALAAFIHLGFGLRGDILLLLNGLGYLSLLILSIWPTAALIAQRPRLYWVLLVYTAVTFLGYFVMHDLGVYSRTELLTKGIEICLIGCLVMQIRQGRRTTQQNAIIA